MHDERGHPSNGNGPVEEPVRLTYRDYCRITDDDKRYEILDGDLHMSPSPTPAHQQVVQNLFREIDDHVRRHRLGQAFIAPLDVVLNSTNVVEPDIIFISNARREIITEKNIRGVPDLLIEVISPSLRKRDEKEKRSVYARCRVPNFWLVDPKKKTLLELKRVRTAYSPVADLRGNAMFKPEMFPGLRIALRDIWPA